jgi:hypothetical protein
MVCLPIEERIFGCHRRLWSFVTGHLSHVISSDSLFEFKISYVTRHWHHVPGHCE